MVKPGKCRRWAGMFLLLSILNGSMFPVWGQFSPGELSRPHKQLEGINNCLKCHEQGKEITGIKCLDCHGEIKAAIAAKHGYHFNVSSQKCVACHKEHLGRDAQTVIFNRNTFDHSLTGFQRTGKHASVRCEDCHKTSNIKDPDVLSIVRSTNRQTFLGLSRDCASCHNRKHGNKLEDCQSCHSTAGWSQVKGFDHSTTWFVLRGNHATVECRQCHTDLAAKENRAQLLFATKPFGDCAPCHLSPHSSGFSRQSCNSCHTPEGWRNAGPGGRFNHDLTAFRLTGKHAGLSCEKCHNAGASRGKTRLKLAHNRCTDCHSDYHADEFAGRFGGDCAGCHTTSGFVPSTFTMRQHDGSKFPLDGAHAAVPCAACHQRNAAARPTFRFRDMRCESCHKDKHGGQFVNEMKERSCAACHSTGDWQPTYFDHARTGFPLAGKHKVISCEKCHRTAQINGETMALFKGISHDCSSCHKEVHAGQFAREGKTDCGTCHQPESWRTLVFNHDTHSRFKLTGAHQRVRCGECHKAEQSGTQSFVRYRPKSITCESCHAGREANQ